MLWERGWSSTFAMAWTSDLGETLLAFRGDRTNGRPNHFSLDLSSNRRQSDSIESRIFYAEAVT